MSSWYRLNRDKHNSNLWRYGGTLEFRLVDGEIEYTKTRSSGDSRNFLPNLRIEDGALVIDLEDIGDVVIRNLETPEVFLRCLQNPEFRKEVFDTITEKYNNIGFGVEEWEQILRVTRESLLTTLVSRLSSEISSLVGRQRALADRIRFIDHVNSVLLRLEVKKEDGEPLRFIVPDEFRRQGDPWNFEYEQWSEWLRATLEAQPSDIDDLRKKFREELKRQGVPFGEGSAGLVRVYEWFDLTDVVLAVVGRTRAREEEKSDGIPF